MFNKKNKKEKKNKKTEEVTETRTKVMDAVGQSSTWRDYILPSCFEIQKDYFCLGDAYCRCYTIFNFPEKVAVNWLAPIIRMDNVIVSVNAEPGNTVELKKSIDFTIQEEQQKRYSKLDTGQLADVQDAEDKINKALELSQRLLGEGSSAENVTIYITVYAPHKEDLDTICKDVEGRLAGNRFIPRVISYKQEEGFMSTYPISMNLYKAHTGLDMPSDVFYAGLPMFTSSALNDKNGIFLGPDSSKNPVFLDLWDKSNKKMNSNMFVIGTSGSGKSTFSKAMMVHEMSHNTKMLVLDVESEYTTFAETFHGNVINTTGDGKRPSVLNVLQLRDLPQAFDDFDTDEELDKFLKERRAANDKNFKGALSTHISWLKSWFKIYLPEITQMHEALLEKALYILYDKFGITEFDDPRKMRNDEFPIIADLYEVLKELEQSESAETNKKYYSDLVAYLESCVHGADRFMFNGITTIDLSNPLSIINVQKLIEMPINVKNAQFFNIMTFAWLEMTKNRFEKVLFMVDEAHQFISEDSVITARKLMEFAKRARKYEAGVILATQNVKDFLNPAVSRFGEGIMTNCITRALFRCEATDLEQIKRLYNLNDGEVEMLRAAGRGQTLLISGNTRQFVNVTVDPVIKLCQKGGGN